MNSGPHIGITSGLSNPLWLEGGRSWQPYADVITAAGGVPVHLDAGTIGREPAVLDALDGLMLTGGKDVHLDSYPNPPDLGGETVAEFMHRHRMQPEAERDAYEIALLHAALKREMPVLGICRGCQVLNVALGGRLILDIELETGTEVRHPSYPGSESMSAYHPLEVAAGTLLAGILPGLNGGSTCNSRHHQSVRMDETLSTRVAAISPQDGIVEAIEVPGARWAVGIQWHPERTGDHEIRRLYGPLFSAFIDAAR